MKHPEMTANAFANAVNIDRTVISRKLSEIKASPVGSSDGAHTYRLADLVTAAAGGSDKAERIRKTRATALSIELKNRETKRQLVDREAVEKLGNLIADRMRRVIESHAHLTEIEKDLLLDDVESLRTV